MSELFARPTVWDYVGIALMLAWTLFCVWPVLESVWGDWRRARHPKRNPKC